MLAHVLVVMTLFPAADQPASPGSISQAPLFKAIPVQVNQGSPVSLDLPAEDGPKNYLVIVGSLSSGDEPSKVAIESASTNDIEPIRIAETRLNAEWLAEANAKRRRMQARREVMNAPENEHHAARFAEEKSFHLFVKENEFHNQENYVEVRARLAAVGEHCLIYIDEEDHPDTFSPEVVKEIIQTYDERVRPAARRLYGNHKDVDRDGKFTILLTHWLSQLSNGKVSIGGFVRGGDFFTDVPPPFSNQCDMMYLNSNIRPGRHLRTLIAHEYTHAITFSEHSFGGYLPGREQGAEDEEGWLSEATAHLAENYAGEGWSNLDYRVSTFLTATDRYRLVVPDYYRAGLWRCHGGRGATYLFLRWCVDRFGEGLLRELTQSSLGGVENLETATQTPFAELFRQWSTAICLSGVCPDADRESSLAYLDLHDRLESRQLCGPRPIHLENGRAELSLAPTSMKPIHVHVPAKAPLRLVIHSSAESKLQVTLARLPDDFPRAILSAQTAGDGTARLAVEHVSGAAVRWRAASWERAWLPQTKENTEPPPVEIKNAEEVFSRPWARGGEILRSEPINLSRQVGHQIVIKLSGVDEAGRKVAAWTTLDLRQNPIPSRETATR